MIYKRVAIARVWLLVMWPYVLGPWPDVPVIDGRPQPGAPRGLEYR